MNVDWNGLLERWGDELIFALRRKSWECPVCKWDLMLVRHEVNGVNSVNGVNIYQMVCQKCGWRFGPMMGDQEGKE